jgi:hypothetical protein
VYLIDAKKCNYINLWEGKEVPNYTDPERAKDSEKE